MPILILSLPSFSFPLPRSQRRASPSYTIEEELFVMPTFRFPCRACGSSRNGKSSLFGGCRSPALSFSLLDRRKMWRRVPLSYVLSWRTKPLFVFANRLIPEVLSFISAIAHHLFSHHRWPDVKRRGCPLLSFLIRELSNIALPSLPLPIEEA